MFQETYHIMVATHKKVLRLRLNGHDDKEIKKNNKKTKLKIKKNETYVGAAQFGHDHN